MHIIKFILFKITLLNNHVTLMIYLYYEKKYLFAYDKLSFSISIFLKNIEATIFRI
jgi:hypothetical protein